MALTFSDGFDSYAATADLLKNWARADAWWTWSAGADQNAATGGIVSAASTSGISSLVPPAGVFGAGQTRVAVGFWLKVSATPAAAVEVLTFLGFFSAAIIARINITTSGFLMLLNNPGTPQATGTTNVCDNAWHWIELSPQIGTAVLQRCLVDGVSQWNANFSLLATDTFAYMQFNSVLNRTMSLSDVIFYNDTGPSFTVAANFPLGARKITTRRPNGDDTIQFTRSTGTSSFALVDELNGDVSDYVESGSMAQLDTYDYEALGFAPSAINAVMVKSYLVNPLPGAILHKALAKSGGVTTEGAEVLTPSVRPAVLHQAFYTDPATAAAWTQAGFDAAKFGIKVGGSPPGLLDGLNPTLAVSASRNLLSAFGSAEKVTIVGGLVTSWNNQNTAVSSLTQPTTSYQPTQVNAGIVPRAAIDFNGDDNKLATIGGATGTLAQIISASSGYVVVSFIADVIDATNVTDYANEALIGDSGGYMGLFTRFTSGVGDEIKAYNYDGTARYATSPINEVTTYVAEWRHEGGQQYIRLNGGPEFSIGSNATGNLAGLFCAGSSSAVPAAASSFDGKIFEIATFAIVPTLAQRNAIVADMMAWVGAANTELLVTGIGANGATTFPDSSTRAHTSTRTGTSQITTTAPISGCASSIITDGSGEVRWNTPVIDGSHPFVIWTVEALWKPSAVGQVWAFGQEWGGAGSYSGFLQVLADGSMRCYNGYPAGVDGWDMSTAAGTISFGTEYFLCMESNGAKVRLYLGLLSGGTFTMRASAVPFGGNATTLGDNFRISASGFAASGAGKFNHIRLSRRTRYNSDAGGTIPTTPFVPD